MYYFIYINGYPGTGKLIPDAKVFHNHRMIDPVAALVNRDHPEYNSIRISLRRYILNIITTSEATKNASWIFTDARCTSDLGSMAAQDYRLAAERRGVTFVPIALSCSSEENLRRISMRAASTISGSTTKLTDPALLLQVRQEETMYRFGVDQELDLDVTELTSSEAAEKISQHLKSLAQ